MDVPQHAAPTDGSLRDRSLFVEVVREVAAIRGVDPLELPPMGEQIDLDALDRMFVDRPEGANQVRGTLTFTYAGCDVQVSADGTIEVDPQRGEPGEDK